MTVFKTFLQVLNRCKGILIMYTAIMISVVSVTVQTDSNNMGFKESKPDMLVMNNDTDGAVAKDMTEYLKKHANFVKVKDDDEAIRDALFYRDVNYIVNIPENFSKDIISGKSPEIEIMSTGDYSAMYAESLVTKYVSTAQCYADISSDENALIENIDSTLSIETETDITTTLDTTALDKAARFFDFMNYALLAGAIFTICTILSSFNEVNVRKRTLVSSTKSSKYNRILLLSNSIFALGLWIIYMVLAFIFCGKETMTSNHGLIFMLNSFIFTICTVTIAFLISSLINSKNAMNGIVNVVALGSSFLCGSFVPIEYLPDTVLNIAHVLPSYWFIKTNEALRTMEKWDMDSLKPLFINMSVVLGFSVLFVIIANIITAKKRKIS